MSIMRSNCDVSEEEMCFMRRRRQRRHVSCAVCSKNWEKRTTGLCYLRNCPKVVLRRNCQADVVRGIVRESLDVIFLV